VAGAFNVQRRLLVRVLGHRVIETQGVEGATIPG